MNGVSLLSPQSHCVGRRVGGMVLPVLTLRTDDAPPDKFLPPLAKISRSASVLASHSGLGLPPLKYFIQSGALGPRTSSAGRLLVPAYFPVRRPIASGPRLITARLRCSHTAIMSAASSITFIST